MRIHRIQSNSLTVYNSVNAGNFRQNVSSDELADIIKGYAMSSKSVKLVMDFVQEFNERSISTIGFDQKLSNKSTPTPNSVKERCWEDALTVEKQLYRTGFVEVIEGDNKGDVGIPVRVSISRTNHETRVGLEKNKYLIRNVKMGWGMFASYLLMVSIVNPDGTVTTVPFQSVEPIDTLKGLGMFAAQRDKQYVVPVYSGGLTAHVDSIRQLSRMHVERAPTCIEELEDLVGDHFSTRNLDGYCLVDKKFLIDVSSRIDKLKDGETLDLAPLLKKRGFVAVKLKSLEEELYAA